MIGQIGRNAQCLVVTAQRREDAHVTTHSLHLVDLTVMEVIQTVPLATKDLVQVKQNEQCKKTCSHRHPTHIDTGT